MERDQILLDPEQTRILKKIAKPKKQNISELLRKMLDEQIKIYNRIQLAAAVKALLVDYSVDEELPAFSALDGEDFHV